MSIRPVLLASFSALVLPAPTYAGILVVDAAGGGAYTQIAAAVAASQDGDTLLVRAGTYDGFTIDARSLRVVADAGASVLVRGSTIVRNLTASQTVVLSGLDVAYLSNQWPTAPASQGEALTVVGNAGHVRVQECQLAGKTWVSGPTVYGGAGLRADANAGSLALARTRLTGGRSGGAVDWFTTVRGGAGLDLTATRAALYDCVLLGGRGSDGFDGCGTGGAGAWARASAGCGLFASGTSMTGGRGGDDHEDIFVEFSAPGHGGDGLVVEAGTAAQLLECTLVGGPVGIALYCPPTIYHPHPGWPSSGAGALFTYAGHRVRGEMPRVMRAGTQASITVQADPGDRLYLWTAPTTGFHVLPSLRGVVIPERAGPAPTRILGTVGASGTLTVSFPAPTLDAGSIAREDYFQVVRRDALGVVTLGSFGVVATIDAAY